MTKKMYLIIVFILLGSVIQALIGCGGSNGNNNSNGTYAQQPGNAPVQPPYGSGYYYNQQNPYGNGGYGGYGYGNGGYATSPMNAGCINGDINCQMQMYNNYNTYGYSAYPINPYNWGGYYNYHNYRFGTGGGAGGYGYGGYMNFCNCPVGTRPIYNSWAGLGCVQDMTIQPYFGAAMYYGLQPNNYQWVNIPQIPNTMGYGGGGYGGGGYGGGNCFSNVAQSCFIDQGGGCGAGGFCRVTAAGSRVGICVSNGSNGGANGVYR